MIHSRAFNLTKKNSTWKFLNRLRRNNKINSNNKANNLIKVIFKDHLIWDVSLKKRQKKLLVK